ncbi:MAG: type III pantothenate kinase [Bacteroidota bacterium]|nr:type III pantothenate kinase [Bacteroidota bacterium]
MILAVDIGNTRVKLAVFQDITLVEKFHCTQENFLKKISEILISYPKIDTLVSASVTNLELNQLFSLNNQIKIYPITRNLKFPFVNLYQTPDTLGIDRMIVSAGASLMYPDKNKLIIDAGSAITYDFVDKDNNYHGGMISLGINMRYRALNHFTAKLPLLELSDEQFWIGQNTNEAIHSGVVNGILMEIDGIINSFCMENDNFIIILTGGDSIFLASRLKNTIFANPNFLLESLNYLYQYQNND